MLEIALPAYEEHPDPGNIVLFEIEEQRDGNDQKRNPEDLLAEMVVAVEGAHFLERMMLGMEAPEEAVAMLQPVEPIVEELADLQNEKRSSYGAQQMQWPRIRKFREECQVNRKQRLYADGRPKPVEDCQAGLSYEDVRHAEDGAAKSRYIGIARLWKDDLCGEQQECDRKNAIGVLFHEIKQLKQIFHCQFTIHGTTERRYPPFIREWRLLQLDD